VTDARAEPNLFISRATHALTGTDGHVVCGTLRVEETKTRTRKLVFRDRVLLPKVEDMW